MLPALSSLNRIASHAIASHAPPCRLRRAELDCRAHPPSTAADLSIRHHQGRNKRCVAIDLHNEEGRELVKRLANQSDVLIENFRPGVMEKWKLGPKDLKPDLIYTRIRCV